MGLRQTVLALRVFWELLRFDLLMAMRGFVAIHSGVCRSRVRRPRHVMDEAGLCHAVACVSVFYWKPIRCLQRSVVTTRILRAYGISAELAIGCRIVPFSGHAWVEVGGRVVNDSAGYQTKLRLLERF